MLDFRTRVRDLVVRVVPESVRRAVRIKRKRPPQPGLPPGLRDDALDSVCQAQQGSGPAAVSYRQISGWRKPSSGTFRVYLELNNGRHWSVVFKNAIRSTEETPGLRGLPARPGLAEYAVYQAAGQLGDHIPSPFSIEEAIPDSQFIYLLEDLEQAGYKSAFDDLDVVWAAGQLPNVQKQVSAALQGRSDDVFITYDARFADELRALAGSSFRRYAESATDHAVSELISRWNELVEIHSDFPSEVAPVAVHGDPNRANTLVPNDKRKPLKLVDWEWAGYGLPHADLASLLKGRPPKITSEAVAEFARGYPELSPDEHSRIHEWARIDTRLFDASYMINQLLDSPDTSRMDLGRYVHVSALEILSTMEGTV